MKQIESGAKEFFHNIPQTIDKNQELHPDDDGFDTEHHMLVTNQSKPIKSWSFETNKQSIMDSIEELNAEKRFLLETTGKERNVKEEK